MIHSDVSKEDSEDSNDDSDDDDDHEDEKQALKPPSQPDPRIYIALSNFRGEQEGDLSVQVKFLLCQRQSTNTHWPYVINMLRSTDVVKISCQCSFMRCSVCYKHYSSFPLSAPSTLIMQISQIVQSFTLVYICHDLCYQATLFSLKPSTRSQAQ